MKVFVSYAHEDEPHRETLSRHLRALVDEGLIVLWHDRRITAGRAWAQDIDTALGSADIVLLLVSADFMASDYCQGVELAEALRRHHGGLTRVVPVILRSCDWEHAAFAQFRALPEDGQPVLEAIHPDQRWRDVAKGLRGTVAELSRQTVDASRPAAAVAATPARPARRILPIPKVSLPFIEIGPFGLPLPDFGGRGRLWWAGALALLLAAAATACWALVRGPMADAREAMRMARYDLAEQALVRVPGWLGAWPGLAAVRGATALGSRTFEPRPDWEAIGTDLDRQRAQRPDDPNLLVLAAVQAQHRNDFVRAGELAAQATARDPQHAEAWFLQGLVQDLAYGQLREAEQAYRRAKEAAPASPQYRANLARVLLDQGLYAQALAEFQQIRGLALARAEEALAHWALGAPRQAADAQRAALSMLADADLAARFYNRREWVFVLPSLGRGHALGADDQRCYVALGEAASRRLAGEDQAAFPPTACADPTQAVREVVAEDLCRFVDGVQAALAPVAARLRALLRMPDVCAAPLAAVPATKS